MSAAMEAMTGRLLRDVGACELVSLTSMGMPCTGTASAVRFDGLFVDVVCQEHAERAEGRGGTSVHFPSAGEVTR